MCGNVRTYRCIALLAFFQDSKLSIKAELKGTYHNLGNENNNTLEKNNIYYLVNVKVINTSDSPIEFLTYSCSTASGVVTDMTDLINCVNTCLSNSITIIELKPGQEFSVPVILKPKKRIGKMIRMGFVFLSPKKVDADHVFQVFNKSIETLDNVIWSDPINISLGYGQPYDIK